MRLNATLPRGSVVKICVLPVLRDPAGPVPAAGIHLTTGRVLREEVTYFMGLLHRGQRFCSKNLTQTQSLQMKCPVSQIFPPLTSFIFPQVEHTRFGISRPPFTLPAPDTGVHSLASVAIRQDTVHCPALVRGGSPACSAYRPMLLRLTTRAAASRMTGRLSSRSSVTMRCTVPSEVSAPRKPIASAACC